MKKHFIYLLAIVGLFLISCENETTTSPDTSEESSSLLILTEGGIGHNNSTLANFSIEDEVLIYDYFRSANNRGLGDTSNEMILYGSKLYIIVNVSGTIEVLDPKTGKSIKQIPMKMEDGQSKQPRQIAAYGGKIYVTSFDDTVTRIDTLTLQADASITVGLDPEGITISDGKLYVSNSGGLNFMNDYDNTISVIDVATFTLDKEIEVVINPSDLGKDSNGNIYIASIGNYFDVFGAFQKFNTTTQEVSVIEEVGAPGKFIIHDNIAYIIKGSYGNPYSVLVYDCLNSKIVRDNFITDNTGIEIIHSIDIDPETGDMFIMESDYSTPGTVYWFNKEGQLKVKIPAVGINPTAAVIL